MGRGGAIHDYDEQSLASVSDAESVAPSIASIRLSYPKSSRLLLGTVANLKQPGFLKALQTKYPLEISLECHSLPCQQRLFNRLPGRASSERRQHVLKPFAVFFYRCGGVAVPWELIGRTETVVYDEYHRFITKLKLSCATADDRRKELRVEIYDRRTKTDRIEDQAFLGATQCSLEDIISEPLLRKELCLESVRSGESGTAVLSAEAIRPMPEPRLITLNVDMASITKGQRRVFYVLSRQLRSGDYTPVYRSEVLGREQRRFTSLRRQVGAITAGIEDKLLRLELYQYNSRGPHTKLGFIQTSVQKLQSTKVNTSLLWWPATSNQNDATITVGRVVVIDTKLDKDHICFRLRVTQ